MKILITSDLFEPTINGVVTSVKNLEKELKKRGHEVRILTVSDKLASYRKGNVYYVMSVPAKIYPDIRIPISRGRDYVKELIAWKPDIVHSQCEFFSFGFAKKIARASGAALIHTYHTLYEQYTEYVPIGKNLSREALGKWMKARLRNVDTIIAPTEKVERTLLEYEMRNRVIVIPTGIRIDQFAKSENTEAVRDIREDCEIPEGKTVLLSLGRLGFEKRIDELLDGVRLLTEQKFDCVLLIVGGGPAEAYLKERVKELELESVVKFTGMVKPEKVADYYKAGDVFVCASTSETQGLTYIEAMASGLPLVCRKDPCLCGVLEEGGNGYFYETLEQFAGGIEKLYESREMFEKACRYSRKQAERFGTEQFGIRVEWTYEKALLERECERNESVVVCKEPEYRFKKWCGTGHAHAGRFS